MLKIPFLKPVLPTSQMLAKHLDQINASGIYSNYGPKITEFEDQIKHFFFG